MPRGARALTEDAEGPRMSMAMRRQLGIAPTKSPSKASSASAREAPRTYIYVYVWQPAARGCRAYSDLSAARVRGRYYAQSAALSTGEYTHMQRVKLHRPGMPGLLAVAHAMHLKDRPGQDCWTALWHASMAISP